MYKLPHFAQSHLEFPARRNAKHRDPCEAATRNPPSSRADYVLGSGAARIRPGWSKIGERAVSVRRSPLYEREMPLHRVNEGIDNDAAVAPEWTAAQADQLRGYAPEALMGGGGPGDGGEESTPRIRAEGRWPRCANPSPRSLVNPKEDRQTKIRSHIIAILREQAVGNKCVARVTEEGVSLECNGRKKT